MSLAWSIVDPVKIAKSAMHFAKFAYGEPPQKQAKPSVVVPDVNAQSEASSIQTNVPNTSDRRCFVLDWC